MRVRIALAAVFFALLFHAPCLGQALVGEISKEDFLKNAARVIDYDTKMPVSGALITIPAENKAAFSDNNGSFQLMSQAKEVILMIKKDGYRPYSVTVSSNELGRNLKFELQKSKAMEIIVADNLIRLGDNSFSTDSANAVQFQSQAKGPSIEKGFQVNDIAADTRVYITFGSIIGVDTQEAKRLKQNNLRTSSSSPVEVFINKTKIGEIKINGDNQKMPVPKQFLKPNAENIITIKTGVNLDQHEYVDYDDIEIANLVVDIE